MVALASDRDGNIFAAGTINGQLELEDGTIEADSDDAFIGKWDRLGRSSWFKKFGDEDLDQATGVAVDADGNAYVTGSFSRSIDFGTGLLTTGAAQGIFLAKLSGDGEPLWASAWGADAFQSTCCLEVGAQGEAVLAGEFVSTLNVGGDDLESAGSSDVFVSVFDADGAHVASRSFGDPATQRVTGLTLDAEGNIALLGAFQGVLSFGGDELLGGEGTSEALYVAKLDPALNHIWSSNALERMEHAEHAHGQTERAHSLAMDAESNLIIQGAYSSGQRVDGQDFEAPAKPQGVLVQYDSQGARTLARAFGSTGTHDEGALALDGDGHRWLAVTFMGGLDLGGEGELESAAGRDIALLELDGRNRLLRSLRYGVAERSEVAWDMLLHDGVVTVGGWSRNHDEFGRDRALIVQFDTGLTDVAR